MDASFVFCCLLRQSRYELTLPSFNCFVHILLSPEELTKQSREAQQALLQNIIACVKEPRKLDFRILAQQHGRTRDFADCASQPSRINDTSAGCFPFPFNENDDQNENDIKTVLIIGTPKPKNVEDFLEKSRGESSVVRGAQEGGEETSCDALGCEVTPAPTPLDSPCGNIDMILHDETRSPGEAVSEPMVFLENKCEAEALQRNEPTDSIVWRAQSLLALRSALTTTTTATNASNSSTLTTDGNSDIANGCTHVLPIDINPATSSATLLSNKQQVATDISACSSNISIKPYLSDTSPFPRCRPESCLSSAFSSSRTCPPAYDISPLSSAPITPKVPSFCIPSEELRPILPNSYSSFALVVRPGGIRVSGRDIIVSLGGGIVKKSTNKRWNPYPNYGNKSGRKSRPSFEQRQFVNKIRSWTNHYLRVDLKATADWETAPLDSEESVLERIRQIRDAPANDQTRIRMALLSGPKIPEGAQCMNTIVLLGIINEEHTGIPKGLNVKLVLA